MALIQASYDLYPRALRAVGLLLLAIVGRGAYIVYQKRASFRRMVKKHGIDILPGHSWVFGHLITVGGVMSKYPSDTYGGNLPYLLTKEYPELDKQGLFYIDIWPVSYTMLAVHHPDMMAQFCQDNSQLKHPQIKNEFRPFTKEKDLVTSDGQQWKRWRAIFNPGFSIQNIMSLVPAFTEEVLAFKKHLTNVAETGEVIQLEKHAMKATCDIIGRAVLGTSLGVQTKERSPLYKALKDCTRLLIPEWSPRTIPILFNPLRFYGLWLANKTMRDQLRPLVKAEMSKGGNIEGSKTILNLALRAYAKEMGAGSAGGTLESDFIETTIEQMKMFLFAGHDTTASVLSFTYYSLYQNSDTLAKVRAEHDAVLGPNPSEAADKISANPILLNQLPYTLAVVKEILRLFPPVGSVRAGGPDFFLTHPETGQQFPTEGMMVFSCSFAMQHHPDYWPDPETFKPDRWLAKNGEASQQRKNTWRPFELGPRGCIGQELAMTELKLILALTVRELDIIPSYDKDAPKLFGSPAYQADVYAELTSHPKSGMPVMIKKRL